MFETQFLLYQTLENRGIHLQNEIEGPYSCNWENTWLGEGYYYWYHHIALAKWWGKSRYGENKYIVFNSKCTDLSKCWDLHTGPGQDLFLYWLSKMKEKELLNTTTTVAQVLEFIKNEFHDFSFEGIRILGVDSIAKKTVNRLGFVRMNFEIPKDYDNPDIQRFKAYFDPMPPVQICLFTKSGMGRVEYELVYPEELRKEYRTADILI